MVNKISSSLEDLAKELNGVPTEKNILAYCYIDNTNLIEFKGSNNRLFYCCTTCKFVYSDIKPEILKVEGEDWLEGNKSFIKFCETIKPLSYETLKMKQRMKRILGLYNYRTQEPNN